MSKKPDGDAPKAPKPSATYGGWHFARDFSSGCFSLLNSGKVYPCFGLLVLCLMGIVAWRLPDTHLAHIVQEFLDTLRSSFGLMAGAFVVSNIGWAWLHKRQRVMYGSEIERLANLRDSLMHKQDDLQKLEMRDTSTGEQKETYIVPSRAAREKKTKEPKE